MSSQSVSKIGILVLSVFFVRTAKADDLVLPERAVAQLGTSLFWQGDRVVACAVSADGKLLASAGIDRRNPDATHLGLWELATGKRGGEIGVSKGVASCLCFAPDGRTLAAGCGKLVVLWDTKSGREIKRYDLHDKNISFVHFAPDGQTVFSGDDSATVHRWDRATGRRLDEWKPWQGEQPRLKNGMRAEEIDVVRLSPDGKTLVWQVCAYKLSEISGLAVGDRYFLRVRALDGKGGVREIKGSPAAFGRIVFAPNGQLVATGFGGVWLWDIPGGRLLRSLGKDLSNVTCLQFSADGRILASSHADDTIRLWDVKSGREIRKFACPKQEGRKDWTPRPLAFSGDGGILVVGGSSGMLLWDVKTGREVRPTAGHREPIRRITFSPDGRTLTTVGDLTYCRWDAATWKEMVHIDQWRTAVANEETLAISTDSARMLTRSAEGVVHLREAATHKALRRWDVGQVELHEGLFAPDGRSAVVGESKGRTFTGIVLDLVNGKERTRLTLSHFFAGPSYSPDSKLLAWLGEDQTIHLVNAITGAEVRQLSEGTLPFWRRNGREQLIFSSQGDYLAVRLAEPSNGVRVFEVSSGTAVGKIVRSRQQGTLTAAAVSPDGRFVATGQDGDSAVRLWEVASGEEYDKLDGHFDTVSALAFSANGATLVSGSRDHTALVWNLQVPRRARKKEYTPEDLSSLWADLRGDARRAVEAMRIFGDIPKQSVPLLKERLSPVEKVTKQQIQQLILDLDSDEFPVREKASMKLAKLAERVEPHLKKTLTQRPTLEVRHRIELLLHNLSKSERDRAAEQLRNIRAVACLEYAATPEARSLLRTLSRGDDDAPLTREAKIALRHLAKRP